MCNFTKRVKAGSEKSNFNAVEVNQEINAKEKEQKVKPVGK